METTIEHRRHRRLNLLEAIMVTPNGHGHEAYVMDISPGGARVTLPSDWAPVDGAALKILFSPDSDHTVLLQARITRVASDHLGVEFCGDQSDNVRQLLQLLDNPG